MSDLASSLSNTPPNSITHDHNAKVQQKKKIRISKFEGVFYCTYLIDENGKKTLISKIPINDMEKQDLFSNDSDFEKLKKILSHKLENNSTNLESKQEIIEATRKINTPEMMQMLNSLAGIPNQVEYKRNLKT